MFGSKNKEFAESLVRSFSPNASSIEVYSVFIPESLTTLHSALHVVANIDSTVKSLVFTLNPDTFGVDVALDQLYESVDDVNIV